MSDAFLYLASALALMWLGLMMLWWDSLFHILTQDRSKWRRIFVRSRTHIFGALVIFGSLGCLAVGLSETATAGWSWPVALVIELVVMVAGGIILWKTRHGRISLHAGSDMGETDPSDGTRP